MMYSSFFDAKKEAKKQCSRIRVTLMTLTAPFPGRVYVRIFNPLVRRSLLPYG